jgi:hypothetical protein
MTFTSKLMSATAIAALTSTSAFAGGVAPATVEAAPVFVEEAAGSLSPVVAVGIGVLAIAALAAAADDDDATGTTN